MKTNSKPQSRLQPTTPNWTEWFETLDTQDHPEAWRGIECFFRWIAVRAENGHAVPTFLLGLAEDMKHSQLLRRLLDGKEPLPHAPPENFGQPWYELIDNGHAIVQKVEPWPWAPESKLQINGGVWTILEKHTDRSFKVYYREANEWFWLHNENTHWLLERPLSEFA